MARGGERPGAGRKPGSRDKTADAARVMAEHAQQMETEIARMTPLQVMPHAMSLEAAKGKWNSAALLARDAAPYLHPRLNAETVKAEVSGPNGEPFQLVTTYQPPRNGRDAAGKTALPPLISARWACPSPTPTFIPQPPLIGERLALARKWMSCGALLPGELPASATPASPPAQNIPRVLGWLLEHGLLQTEVRNF